MTRTPLFTASQSVLNELWENTGDSCYIGVLKEKPVLYMIHPDSARNLKIAGQTGGEYPINCTAPGMVLLAYADESSGSEYCKGCLKSQAVHTITDSRKLKEDPVTVREQGYTTDAEEYGCGIICVTAPIFDRNGAVAGTVGISIATVYRNERGLLADQGVKVGLAAEAISKKIGYSEEK